MRFESPECQLLTWTWSGPRLNFPREVSGSPSGTKVFIHPRFYRQTSCSVDLHASSSSHAPHLNSNRKSAPSLHPGQRRQFCARDISEAIMGQGSLPTHQHLPSSTTRPYCLPGQAGDHLKGTVPKQEAGKEVTSRAGLPQEAVSACEQRLDPQSSERDLYENHALVSGSPQLGFCVGPGDAYKTSQ